MDPHQTTKCNPTEIGVGTNECRLAHRGERLVARGVLADVVVVLQVQTAGFAAMLRFTPPGEPVVSQPRLEALWEFSDQALTLVFESVRALNIPLTEIQVSVIGGADLPGLTYGRGKQLSLAVQRSLWRQEIVPSGKDLGGAQDRSVWLESSSGRLIVRSTSSSFHPHVQAATAKQVAC